MNTTKNILFIQIPFTDDDSLRIGLQQHIQNVPRVLALIERLHISRLQLQLLHWPISVVCEQENSLFAAEHPINIYEISTFRSVFQFLYRDLLREQQFLWVFEGRFCTGNRPLSKYSFNSKFAHFYTLAYSTKFECTKLYKNLNRSVC